MQKKLLSDAQFKQSLALPAAASSNVTSTSYDLGAQVQGDLVADVELLIEAPALTVTELPNGDTVTYNVIVSPNSNLSSPTKTLPIGVQTGAGGAGAPAASYRYHPSMDDAEFIGVQIVTGAGTGNCSTSSAQINLVF